MSISPRLRPVLFITVCAILILAACAPVQVTPTAVPTQAATPLPTIEPTPTEPAETSLVVCLGYEPTSLYIYGASLDRPVECARGGV